MITTLQAALHLGQDYDQNSRSAKNHFWSSLKNLCKETEKLIKDQTEIIGVSVIDYKEYTWSATSLLCDRIHQISNAKTYVFADSVLCLGGTKGNPNEAWEEKLSGILRKLFERFESFLWRIVVTRVENIPRTHNIWPHSRIHERTKV